MVIIYGIYTLSKLKRKLSLGETKWRCIAKRKEHFWKTIVEKKILLKKMKAWAQFITYRNAYLKIIESNLQFFNLCQ